MNSKKNTLTLKKTLVVAVSLAVIGGIAFLTYGVMTKNDAAKNETLPNSVNYDPPSNEQKEAGDRQKEETIKESDNPGKESPQEGQTVDVTLTALNQSDGQLQVRTLIDAVNKEGSCTLTLTKNNDTVTKQSGIQAGPNSSTCMGFNVPTSELSAGTWTVLINVVTGTQKGSATKTFTVM